MNEFSPKGSIWRKWDLQIQPIKQEWFSSINDDNTIEKKFICFEDLKKKDENKR